VSKFAEQERTRRRLEKEDALVTYQKRLKGTTGTLSTVDCGAFHHYLGEMIGICEPLDPIGCLAEENIEEH
jgi:hypothetical protein